MKDGETSAADPEAPLEQGMAAGMQELLMELLPCSTGDPHPLCSTQRRFSLQRREDFLSNPMMKKKPPVVEGMGHGLSSLPQCF